MIPPSVMMAGGYTGLLNDFQAYTNQAVNGLPVKINLDWTPNGDVTDAYEVRLYYAESLTGYPPEGTDQICTETSPVTTSIRVHTTDIIYNSAGPKVYITVTAKLYSPDNILLDSHTDIYAMKGYA